MRSFYYSILIIYCLSFNSCTSDYIIENNGTKSATTKSIPVTDFDWENVDWMPTPSGQTKISPPWIGQGSLSSTYGLDVLTDIKKKDGWVLLYNTFSSDVSQLANPYFILYNKYRGIMRIYLYLTTPFVVNSSYIQDGISITSTNPSCLLNFLGTDIVDVSKSNQNYMQMQGAPQDGSLPLASNKWYMLQYELAYDSSLGNTDSKNSRLNWIMNYYNVTKIQLGGSVVGKLSGTIGSSSKNIFSSLMSLGTTTGTGVFAAVGSQILSNHQTDSTGGNNIGLPSNIFKEALSGVTKAIGNSTNSIPKNVVNLLSAIVGGSSSSSTPISLNLNADIILQGSATDGGSFPSSPTSFWIPGTIFTSSTQGYIPYYNKPLGVLYLSSKPSIKIKDTFITTEYETREGDPLTTGSEDIYEFPTHFDYSSYLIINPEVLKIADVKILKQDLVTVYKIYNNKTKAYDRIVRLNVSTLDVVNDPYRDKIDDSYQDIGVRFTIRVTPKDGSPSSDIYKTFSLTQDLDITYYDRRALAGN